MKFSNIMTITLVLLFSSCSFVPEYVKPKLPVPEKISTESNIDLDSKENPQNISWDDFVKDEKLKKILKIGLENNKDIKIAILNVEKLKALYGIQRASLYPSLSTSADMIKKRTPEDLSKDGKVSHSEQYDVTLGISAWEIDFFGRLRSLKESSLEEFLAMKESHKAVTITIISEIARTYLNYAYAKSLYKLTEEILKSEQEIHKIISKRFELGLSPEIDLIQSRTRVESIKVELANIKNKISLEENYLQLLTGNKVTKELLPSDLEDIDTFKEFFPQLDSEILLGRPDIQFAERKLKSANANIGAARSAFFPRITLTTNIGSASKELSGLFEAGSGSWLFVPQITMPIFDPRTWYAYDVAKAEKELAIANYEKAIQIAFREVADVIAVRENIEYQLAVQTDIVNSYHRSLNISVDRYLKGIDSYLRVLELQKSLLLAKQKLIDLKLLKLQNAMNLYKSFGGGINSIN